MRNMFHAILFEIVRIVQSFYLHNTLISLLVMLCCVRRQEQQIHGVWSCPLDPVTTGVVCETIVKSNKIMGFTGSQNLCDQCCAERLSPFKHAYTINARSFTQIASPPLNLLPSSPTSTAATYAHQWSPRLRASAPPRQEET